MGQEQSRPIEVNLENVEDVYAQQVANQKVTGTQGSSLDRSAGSPERRPPLQSAVGSIAFEGPHAPQAHVLRPTYPSFMCYTPTRACVSAQTAASPERRALSPEQRSRSASPMRSPGRVHPQLVWAAPSPSPQCFYYSPACVCGSNVSHSPERRTGRLRSDCSPDRSPNRSPDRKRHSHSVGCHHYGCATPVCGCSNEANLTHSPERRARQTANQGSGSQEGTEAGNQAEPCKCPACRFFNGGPPVMAGPANVTGSPRGTPQGNAESSPGTPQDWRSPAVRQIAPRGSAAHPASPPSPSCKPCDDSDISTGIQDALEQAKAWDNLTSDIEGEALWRTSKPPSAEAFMSSLGLCGPRTPCTLGPVSCVSGSHCCANRKGDEDGMDGSLVEGAVEVVVQSPVLHRWKDEPKELNPVPLVDDLPIPTAGSQNLGDHMALTTGALPVQNDNGHYGGPKPLTQREIDEIVMGLKDTPDLSLNKEEADDRDSNAKSPTSEGRSPLHSPGRRQRERRSPQRRVANRQRRGGAGQTCTGSPRRRTQGQNVACGERHQPVNDMIIEVKSSGYTTSL